MAPIVLAELGFDLRSFRPDRRQMLGYLVSGLKGTFAGDELDTKETHAFLDRLDVPQIPADRNVLKAFALASTLPSNAIDQEAAVYNQFEGLIGNAFKACHNLRVKLDGELANLPAERKTFLDGLGKNALNALIPLVKGDGEVKKTMIGLINLGALAGSDTLVFKSEEQAWKITPFATNFMWACEVFANLYNPNATAAQMWHSLVLRVGIASATYIAGFIELFITVPASGALTAGMCIWNILCTLAYFALPDALAFKKGEDAKKEFARNGPVGVDENAVMGPIADALDAFLAENETAMTETPPSNRTRKIATNAQTEVRRLSDALRRDAPAPASATTRSIWSLRTALKNLEFRSIWRELQLGAKSAPSAYALVVGWGQFLSSIGNAKTMADNTPLLVLMHLLMAQSLINRDHSPKYMFHVLLQASVARFISLGTSSSILINDRIRNHRSDVFNRDPEFSRNMAYLTAALVVVGGKQIVPLFDLMIKIMSWSVTKCVRRARQEGAFSDDDEGARRLIEELEDEDWTPAEQQSADELLLAFEKRWRREVKASGDTDVEVECSSWIAIMAGEGAFGFSSQIDADVMAAFR